MTVRLRQDVGEGCSVVDGVPYLRSGEFLLTPYGSPCAVTMGPYIIPTDAGHFLSQQVRAILNKYNATLLLPGVSGTMRFGYQPGNYLESTGQTLAAADQQVGLVVDAARVPGPELVTNGTFDSSSGWTLGTGFTVSGGMLNVSTSTNDQATMLLPSLVSGRSYRITIDHTYISGATIKIRLGGSAGQEIVLTNASSTKGFVLVAGTSPEFRIRTDGSSVAKFDNVSVRELPGIHASQSTSGFQPVLRNTSGIQSWQFDGTDDRLSLSAVPFQTQDVSFAITAFNPSVSDATYRRLFDFSGTTSTNQISLINGTADWRINGDSGNQAILSSGAICTAGVNRVVSAVNASLSSRYLRVDGVQQGAVNTTVIGTSTENVATIGNRAAGDRAFSGFKHLQIFGKGAISDSELLTLERFVASLQGRVLS